MRLSQKTFDKISIRQLPPMRVATYKVLSHNPEPEAMNFMKEILQKKNLNFNELRKFGVMVSVPEPEHNLGLRGYECWVCLPNEIKNLFGLTIKNIPNGNYAVLRIKKTFESSFDAISNGWLELYDWVKANGYKTTTHNANRDMLEEQITIAGNTYLDLYYPVCIYEFAN